MHPITNLLLLFCCWVSSSVALDAFVWSIPPLPDSSTLRVALHNVHDICNPGSLCFGEVRINGELIEKANLPSRSGLDYVTIPIARSLLEKAEYDFDVTVKNDQGQEKTMRVPVNLIDEPAIVIEGPEKGFVDAEPSVIFTIFFEGRELIEPGFSIGMDQAGLISTLKFPQENHAVLVSTPLVKVPLGSTRMFSAWLEYPDGRTALAMNKTVVYPPAAVDSENVIINIANKMKYAQHVDTSRSTFKKLSLKHEGCIEPKTRIRGYEINKVVVRNNKLTVTLPDAYKDDFPEEQTLLSLASSPTPISKCSEKINRAYMLVNVHDAHLCGFAHFNVDFMMNVHELMDSVDDTTQTSHVLLDADERGTNFTEPSYYEMVAALTQKPLLLRGQLQDFTCIRSLVLGFGAVAGSITPEEFGVMEGVKRMTSMVQCESFFQQYAGKILSHYNITDIGDEAAEREPVLLISRKNSRWRRIINEQDLVANNMPNIKAVEMHTLSIREQLQLIRNSSVAIGMNGANQGILFFVRPKSTFLGFYPLPISDFGFSVIFFAAARHIGACYMQFEITERLQSWRRIIEDYGQQERLKMQMTASHKFRAQRDADLDIPPKAFQWILSLAKKNRGMRDCSELGWDVSKLLPDKRILK